MKTQQTGWKLKKSSPKRAKDKEIENRRKSEDWFRKYNTHITGVLERKTCHQKRIRQLERTCWCSVQQMKTDSHIGKLLWNLEYWGKEKILQGPRGKKKKVRYKALRTRMVSPFQQQHWRGAYNRAMPSHFWRWFGFDLEFFVQDRHAFRWEDRDLSGDFPGGPVAKTCAPSAGGLDSTAGQGIRSHRPHLSPHTVRKIKDPARHD